VYNWDGAAKKVADSIVK